MAESKAPLAHAGPADRIADQALLAIVVADALNTAGIGVTAKTRGTLSASVTTDATTTTAQCPSGTVSIDLAHEHALPAVLITAKGLAAITVAKTVDTGFHLPLADKAPGTAEAIAAITARHTALLVTNLVGVTASIAATARCTLPIITTMSVVPTMSVFPTARSTETEVIALFNHTDVAIAAAVIEATTTETNALHADLSPTAVAVVPAANAAVVLDAEFLASALVVIQTTPSTTELKTDFAGLAISVSPTASKALVGLADLPRATSVIGTTARSARATHTNVPRAAVRVLATRVATAILTTDLPLGTMRILSAIPRPAAVLHTEFTLIAVVISAAAWRALAGEADLAVDATTITPTSFPTAVLFTNLTGAAITILHATHADTLVTDAFVALPARAGSDTLAIPANQARPLGDAVIVGFTLAALPTL